MNSLYLFNNIEYDFQKITNSEEIKKILELYINKYYNELDDKDTWFNKIKELCDELGYASNMKEYKENPDNYKGNIADVSTVIRVALTSSSMTPDLYELMKLFGTTRIKERLNKYKEFTIGLFSIERYQKKPRKDFESWSTVKNNIWYMYDELFNEVNYDFQKINNSEEIKNILEIYINKYYNELDDKDTWFNKIKELCDELGYASNMKDYKENPENYKGNIADVSTVIRVALTSSSMTPDLYELMKLLGTTRIKQRINKFIEN